MSESPDLARRCVAEGCQVREHREGGLVARPMTAERCLRLALEMVKVGAMDTQLDTTQRTARRSETCWGQRCPNRRASMLDRITRHPTSFALLFALLLGSPVLSQGFRLDDFIQLERVEMLRSGRDIPRGPLGVPNLFHFRDARETKAGMALGTQAWWRHPEESVVFWRPLSSLLHLSDHFLFGANPAFHYAHSLLWLLLVVIAAAAVLRPRLPPGVFALAIVLFALDDTRALPTGWIAGRNALVAGALGLAGLWAHLRYREQGFKPGALLSPLLLGLSLLSGETGLGAFAYLGAYELLGRTDSPRRRWAALVPATVVLSVWAALYMSNDFGGRHGVQYLHPIRDLQDYLEAAPQRALVLLAAQLAGVSATYWMFSERVLEVQMAIGLLCLPVAAGVVHFAVRDLDAAQRLTLRWLSVGALLALVPGLSTMPMDRLLVLPSLGGCVIVALGLRQLCSALLRFGEPSLAIKLVGLMAVPALFMHLVLQPLQWFGQVAFVHTSARRDAAAERELGLDDPKLADKIVLEVGGARPAQAPEYRMAQHKPMPRYWGSLTAAPRTHRLTRTGPRSLVIEAVGGGYFERPPAVFRRPAHLVLKRRVELPEMTATIIDTGPSGPTSVAFQLERDLDDNVLLIGRRRGAAVRLELPPIGGSLKLE